MERLECGNGTAFAHGRSGFVARNPMNELWRPSRHSLPALLLLLALPLLAGCTAQRQARLFEHEVAREALACLHPRGIFESTGPVQSEGRNSFVATIVWHGEVLHQPYTSRVRVVREEGVAVVTLLAEDSLLPALRRECRIPLGR